MTAFRRRHRRPAAVGEGGRKMEVTCGQMIGREAAKEKRTFLFKTGRRWAPINGRAVSVWGNLAVNSRSEGREKATKEESPAGKKGKGKDHAWHTGGLKKTSNSCTGSPPLGEPRGGTKESILQNGDGEMAAGEGNGRDRGVGKIQVLMIWRRE